jgi:hypothetical protein
MPLLLMFSFSPLRAPPLNNDHRSQNGSFAASWMDDDVIALFLFPLLRPLCASSLFLFFANCLVRLHPTWPLRRPKLSLCFTFCVAIGLFLGSDIYFARLQTVGERDKLCTSARSATRTQTQKSGDKSAVLNWRVQ